MPRAYFCFLFEEICTSHQITKAGYCVAVYKNRYNELLQEHMSTGYQNKILDN